MSNVTTAWRAILRAVAAAIFAPRSRAPDNPDDAVQGLQRRRLLLLKMLNEPRSEAEVAELCELRDRLAGEISRLPTSSLAVARVKLGIVLEEYLEPHTADGFDLRLLLQVQDWMRDVDDGVRKPAGRGRPT